MDRPVRKRDVPLRARLLAFLLLLFLATDAFSLPMGINKVRYHEDQRWTILETEHFEIYHSQGCEELAQIASKYAEEAYRTVSRVLEFVPKTKVPLFIYGDPLEFQETNITSGYLPEGVGGFTEVFKNRVAVPMTGSYHELEKVILHELMHAFQYDLIYGEGWRSLNLFKAVFIPQWMMEGSAEWVADHWESQGEMVVRDAVLNDSLIPLSMMESFNHFEQVYLAYKQSQSILEYVSQVYGRSKVPLMLKAMTANQSGDAVAKKALGIPLDRLYADWSFFMKSTTWSRVNGMPAPSRYGEPLEMTAAKAAASPDGKWVACLNANELFLLELPKKERRSLRKGKFQTQGSGVVWSPDSSTLAYAANPGGRQTIHLLDLKTRQERECNVPGIPWALSPEWSPDGKYIVFSGFDHRTMDLYRWEVATGRWDRLTKDPAMETWARFSPKGDRIFCLLEEKGETSLESLSWEGEFPAAKVPVPLDGPWGRLASLHRAKDGFYLTSDRDGRIFNLYRWREGGVLTQLTRSFVDVLSAAPSPEGGTFYACLYQKGRQSLHEFHEANLESNARPQVELGFLTNSFGKANAVIATGSKGPSVPEEAFLEVGEKEEGREPGKKSEVFGIPAPVDKLEVEEASNIVQLRWGTDSDAGEGVTQYRVYRAQGEDNAFEFLGTVPLAKGGKFVDYEVKEGDSYLYQVTAVNVSGESPPSPVVRAKPGSKLVTRNYDFNLSPDILLFIAGYDSSFGFVGGGVFQFSDHLGDHRLALLGDTIPGVRTGLEAAYQFSLLRTQVDLRVFHYENFFRILELQTGGLVNEYRNNEEGLDLSFGYPIDETTRFEYGLGTQRFKGNPDHLRFSEGLSNYFEDEDRWSVANYYRISFVQDKRQARRFTPSAGHGLNLTLLHALPILDQNVSFANLLFEAQSFQDLDFLDHAVLASRFVLMTSQGPQPQSFFIGNDAPFQAYFTTLRGYGGRTFFGKNLGLLNLELRYPMATSVNFPLAPLSFIMVKDIELAGFLDAGIVSEHVTELGRAPVLGSAGVGLRFYNVIYQRALVMLRFDVAWRLDRPEEPTFHFNLAPMF